MHYLAFLSIGTVNLVGKIIKHIVLFRLYYARCVLQINIFLVNSVGCQAVLSLWDGTWRISKAGNPQPGALYLSYEIPSSYMADISSVYSCRQVGFFFCLFRSSTAIWLDDFILSDSSV